MNIVTATFSAGCTQIDADRKLWQYDQGQILQLVGLDLPDAYQVEFSNTRDKGSAKAQIGGPDGVQIPDEYLTTGKPVYAFLVGHTAEEDRETEKLVVIYVNARSQPTDEPITPEQQTIVDQLIAALTAGVEKAEAAAAQAEAAISYMPKIVDGTWWVYDAETETWADTGIQAEGQDGVGISGAVLNADYTLTLTFSDGTSYTTPSIRGPKGEAAPTDYILVQPTQPTSPTNRLWVDSDRGSTVQLPTMADHQALAGAVADNTEAIGDLSDELADQKSAIDDLTALTNRKAGMLVDTASGAIASFVPDSTIDNLLGVSVAIEPVQDLHGYDSPWPAGGGVNKFDPSQYSSYLQADGTYKATAVQIQPIQNYIPAELVGQQCVFSCYLDLTNSGALTTERVKASINGAIAFGNKILNGEAGLSSVVFTPSSTDDWVGFEYGTNGWDNLVFSQLQLELGSTPTTYSPYENICPISGWDSVKLDADGVNLFDKAKTTHLYCDGTMTLRENSDMLSVFVELVQGATYTFTQTSVGTFTRYAVCDSLEARVPFYNPRNGTAQTYINTVPFTFTANRKYLICTIYRASADVGKTFDDFADTCQLTVGSTTTDYHPYAGNRYTIQLGQTVYGGTLDVTNGTMTVDRVTDTLTGHESIVVLDMYYVVGTTHPHPIWTAANVLCSHFARSGLNSVASGNSPNNAWFRLDKTVADFATSDAFQAYIVNQHTAGTPVQISYRLATPITITLDPVTIAAIAGQTNNVWADAVDVAVEFAADLKHYIDSKIAALSAQIVNS